MDDNEKVWATVIVGGLVCVTTILLFAISTMDNAKNCANACGEGLMAQYTEAPTLGRAAPIPVCTCK